ncbi:hypothetical protein BRD09_00850 [Halobacteriales archaeon SW_10_68_16]|jgi:hypothetical protein|nr:MAG: hypothetical protein BRD09_00850 [Halobacteriales archaeon SW_10_68_16]
MADFGPYDEWNYSEDELVEMAMGNPVGDVGLSMQKTRFNLTKIQGELISRALAQYDGFESDLEREVAERTEQMIREKSDFE